MFTEAFKDYETAMRNLCGALNVLADRKSSQVEGGLLDHYIFDHKGWSPIRDVETRVYYHAWETESPECSITLRIKFILDPDTLKDSWSAMTDKEKKLVKEYCDYYKQVMNDDWCYSPAQCIFQYGRRIQEHLDRCKNKIKVILYPYWEFTTKDFVNEAEFLSKGLSYVDGERTISLLKK